MCLAQRSGNNILIYAARKTLCLKNDTDVAAYSAVCDIQKNRAKFDSVLSCMEPEVS